MTLFPAVPNGRLWCLLELILVLCVGSRITVGPKNKWCIVVFLHVPHYTPSRISIEKEAVRT
jgi:hypothetical protein